MFIVVTIFTYFNSIVLISLTTISQLICTCRPLPILVGCVEMAGAGGSGAAVSVVREGRRLHCVRTTLEP